jgi:hypothetical protein
MPRVGSCVPARDGHRSEVTLPSTGQRREPDIARDAPGAPPTPSSSTSRQPPASRCPPTSARAASSPDPTSADSTARRYPRCSSSARTCATRPTRPRSPTRTGARPQRRASPSQSPRSSPHANRLTRKCCHQRRCGRLPRPRWHTARQAPRLAPAPPRLTQRRPSHHRARHPQCEASSDSSPNAVPRSATGVTWTWEGTSISSIFRVTASAVTRPQPESISHGNEAGPPRPPVSGTPSRGRQHRGGDYGPGSPQRRQAR